MSRRILDRLLDMAKPRPKRFALLVLIVTASWGAIVGAALMSFVLSLMGRLA